ncbi:MAG: hypothetical protein NT076_05570 [Candidatus Pacearchaeota archaeon]|nr:hypothetical protein [Candidatus Pacearchaeota archaeon]
MKTYYFSFFSISFLLIVALAIITSSISFVSASCSLGASPLEMQAQASPGQTVDIYWNIFNLRGDRATHILINQSKGPAWNVIYLPQASIKQYDVSGIMTNSFENFAVDKSTIVKIKPEPLPSGKVAYIVHPNSSEGYILVDKQIKISVKVPDDAELGKAQDFVFEAVGKCFGETGSVSASLATELKVKITPVSETYYEKEVSSSSLGQKISSIFSQTQIKPIYAVTIGITLVLIIVLIILFVLMNKKRKKVEKKIKKGKRK